MVLEKSVPTLESAKSVEISAMEAVTALRLGECATKMGEQMSTTVELECCRLVIAEEE